MTSRSPGLGNMRKIPFSKVRFRRKAGLASGRDRGGNCRVIISSVWDPSCLRGNGLFIRDGVVGHQLRYRAQLETDREGSGVEQEIYK